MTAPVALIAGTYFHSLSGFLSFTVICHAPVRVMLFTFA